MRPGVLLKDPGVLSKKTYRKPIAVNKPRRPFKGPRGPVDENLSKPIALREPRSHFKGPRGPLEEIPSKTHSFKRTPGPV